MIEITKKELHNILKAHPDGGVVFVPPDDQMVHISYKSDFGATCLEIDEDDEPYCYDWSINEYGDDELFKLYEDKDILALIKVLVFCLPEYIELQFSHTTIKKED